jgi:hypothetical protein
LDEKEKDRSTQRLAQSAREISTDDKSDEFGPKLSKGKYDSEPKLTYIPRKDNPFLDLINDKDKKKRKDKKPKKDKKLPDRKGSFGTCLDFVD